jgi:hypothetical protein
MQRLTNTRRRPDIREAIPLPSKQRVRGRRPRARRSLPCTRRSNSVPRAHCMVAARAVRQVTLFYRSSQASDTRARGNRPPVLGSGRRADIAVFGRSDDSNEDRAEQKHREQNQPGPGRRQIWIGHAHQSSTHAHCRQPRVTSVVESSGDLVACRWPSGVQLEWVARMWKGPPRPSYTWP